MAELLDELNKLLARERGEMQAVKALMDEVEQTEPDVADGARDVFDTSSWSCKGLYHRITQLGGTPTLSESSLADELSDLPDTRSKIEVLCSSQREDLELVEALRKRKRLDGATREFLEDLARAHEDTLRWCNNTLGEWKRDV